MKPRLLGVLLVGCGGFVGAAVRNLLNAYVSGHPPLAGFPFGTLIVNVSGCLVIGLLAALTETRPVFREELRLFLFLGLLGGFTTFSTFGWESVALLRDGVYLSAFANVALHVVLGTGAVWAGYAAASAR